MPLRQSVRHISRIGRSIICKPEKESGSRSFSSSVPVFASALRRSALFSHEQNQQREAVGRINKIEVNVVGSFGNELLMMNQDLSTPYDCARHISEHLSNHSIVALVTKEDKSSALWDMRRPLTESCQLQFLKTTDKNPYLPNIVFWRSCSFMLGAAISEAFKDDITVHLHSFPPPIIESGSFVVNAYLSLDQWKPTPEELRALSQEVNKLGARQLPFERLSVSQELAEEMFSDNPYKLEQIPQIYKKKNEVVLYRVGDHIDISGGPMMNHTGLLGRCSIPAVHYIEEQGLYRFQGVALPQGHKLNHYAYGILEKRAEHLNNYTAVSSTKKEAPSEQKVAL